MTPRPSIGWWCASLLLVTATATFSDAWTNAAGRVVDASFVELNGRVVVLKTADGELLNMPLKSLSIPAQEKAKQLAGLPVVPEIIQQIYCSAEQMILRPRLLLANGQLIQEEFDAIQLEARNRFDRELNASVSSDLLLLYAEDISQLKARL